MKTYLSKRRQHSDALWLNNQYLKTNFNIKLNTRAQTMIHNFDPNYVKMTNLKIYSTIRNINYEIISKKI